MPKGYRQGGKIAHIRWSMNACRIYYCVCIFRVLSTKLVFVVLPTSLSYIVNSRSFKESTHRSAGTVRYLPYIVIDEKWSMSLSPQPVDYHRDVHQPSSHDLELRKAEKRQKQT